MFQWGKSCWRNDPQRWNEIDHYQIHNRIPKYNNACMILQCIDLLWPYQALEDFWIMYLKWGWGFSCRGLYILQEISLWQTFGDYFEYSAVKSSHIPLLPVYVFLIYINQTTVADASTQWCSSGDPMLICIIGTHWKTTGATSTLGCHWNHTGWC